MNNFSPSTDTSVGTKRFTAQEVQLAYTLMAVEYMKTIKGLNPNHQLVDKAVKLKALGFTNSKEVGPLRYVTGMQVATCLLIACPIRLEGTSLGRNLPILDLCI